jgi:hypothetical protein
MLTNKPTDPERPKTPSRSGHGAASVIPHLDEEGRRQRRGSVGDAPAESAESESASDTDPGPAKPGSSPKR